MVSIFIKMVVDFKSVRKILFQKSMAISQNVPVNLGNV